MVTKESKKLQFFSFFVTNPILLRLILDRTCVQTEFFRKNVVVCQRNELKTENGKRQTAAELW